MDLTSLKQKIMPYMSKIQPLVNEAKDIGSKALDFTQKQAKETPIFVKTEEEYNILMSAKRAILLAYDDRDPLSKEIILRSPVWSTKAWMDASEIRFFSISSDETLSKTLNIIGPIEMRVSYAGTEYLRTNSLDEMKKWWDNRCYKKDENRDTAESPNWSSDPMVSDPLTETIQNTKK